jgi:hypothetical protein
MSTTQILVSTGAVTLAGVFLYARYLHGSFRSQVQHRSMDATGRRAASKNGELETLPKELLDHPEDFRIIHDRDEKKLAHSEVFESGHAEELFTKLTRRNMAAFSNLPQSWMMSAMAKTPEQRHSFMKSHLHEIDYREGDLFCGFYRVIKRSPFKVEIDMEPPPGVGPLSGRLIVSLNRSAGGAVLRTETLQWIEKSSNTALPLERPSIRFMHEMATFWLLVSGAAYLESLTLG